jgi:hypothetical protein
MKQKKVNFRFRCFVCEIDITEEQQPSLITIVENDLGDDKVVLKTLQVYFKLLEILSNKLLLLMGTSSF